MKRKAAAEPTRRSGQLIPLGVYIEEAFRAAGRSWPPTPRAAHCQIMEDDTPEGGDYLALTAIHGSSSQPLFKEPFFSIPLPDGGACVADFGGHRLCVLATAGTEMVPIGKRGRGAGAFTGPLGLALSASGCLVVADGGDRVQILDPDGVAVQCMPTPPPHSTAHDAIAAPPAAFEPWLPHKGGAALGLSPRRTLQPGELSALSACSPQRLAHDGSCPPSAVGTSTMSSLPPPGAQAPRGDSSRGPPPVNGQSATTVHWQLRNPYGVALGPNGRVYVSDKGHHRVVCFDASGEVAFSFGAHGAGPGELNDPRGLCVACGRVWVADMCNHRIAVFTLRGRPLAPFGRYGERPLTPPYPPLPPPPPPFGRYGERPGEFRHPVGVALCHDLILVSEYTGGRVQVLSASGACLQQIHAPFDGACLGAIGANARRATVTDSTGRLHCFHLMRQGPEPIAALSPTEDDEQAAAQSQLEETRDAEMARLRQTRSGRVQLALRAADYRGVLESLTRDDLAALVPAAYAHAAEHPELYSLPPVRSADELTAELEEEWAGLRQTPPLGPPH